MSPGDGRGRPITGGPETPTKKSFPIVPQQADDGEHAGTPAQVRRRRDAALRLPALDDTGVRDPLDRLRRNTIRAAHVYLVDGSRNSLVRATDLPELRRVLDGLGIFGQWSRTDRAVVVGKAGVEDLIAYLEHRGWRVRVHHTEATR